MNEELENQLAKLVSKAIEAAEKTGEFVIDQAPDLLQQFYMWHTTKWIFFCVLSAAFIPSIKYLSLFGSKDKPEQSIAYKFMGRWFVDGNEFPVIMFGVIVFIMGTATLLFSAYQLLFILTAPKIYLIEHFLKCR